MYTFTLTGKKLNYGVKMRKQMRITREGDDIEAVLGMSKSRSKEIRDFVYDSMMNTENVTDALRLIWNNQDFNDKECAWALNLVGQMTQIRGMAPLLKVLELIGIDKEELSNFLDEMTPEKFVEEYKKFKKDRVKAKKKPWWKRW
jgi:hypothetical protein